MSLVLTERIVIINSHNDTSIMFQNWNMSSNGIYVCYSGTIYGNSLKSSRLHVISVF